MELSAGASAGGVSNIPGAILNFYMLEIGGVEFERGGVSPGSP